MAQNFRISMIAVLAAGASLSQAQVFGSASNYNVFTFGNFTSNYSDTEGKMAVGGKATLQGYDIGLKNPGGNAIITGGKIDFRSGTIRGKAYYGSTFFSQSTGWTDGGSAIKGSLIDFNASRTELRKLSEQWSGLAANGTSKRETWGEIKLTGTNTGLNIFRVDSSWFNGSNSVNINVPTGASALINLTGGNLNVPSIGFNYNGSQDPTNFSRVLWNSPSLSSVSFSSMQGSVLTPFADVTGSNGVVNGQFIANSFKGPTQMNWVQYKGTKPVPEPGTMIALGAGALALLRRRKRSV